MPLFVVCLLLVSDSRLVLLIVLLVILARPFTVTSSIQSQVFLSSIRHINAKYHSASL
jgi:hypothetical protein